MKTLPRNEYIIQKDLDLHPDAVLEVLNWPTGSGLPNEDQHPPFDDVDLIRVAPANGGGFVKLISLANITSLFRVVSGAEHHELLASSWRIVTVGFEWGPKNLKAWWNGQRWNGWAVPFMTPKQFSALAKKWSKDPDFTWIEHADGSKSPHPEWSVFEVIVDADGSERHYHVSGQDNERRIDNRWWITEKLVDGQYVIGDRDTWEEIAPLPVQTEGLPEGVTGLIDVSCGLTWDVFEDPYEQNHA